MKKQTLKITLVIITILSLISTMCFATEGNELLTTSIEENTETSNEQSTEQIEGTTDGEPNSSNEENASTEENNTETIGTTDTTEEESELEIHEGDLWERGDNIEINRAVNGNVFAFANEKVTIKSGTQINGDLYVIAGSEINMEKGSTVYGYVYAIAPRIYQNGVLWSLYAIADNYECGYDGLAAFDIKVYAKTINFAGYIERHVYLAASEALTLTKDAYILGNFNYAADNVNIDENATIKGKTIANSFSNVSPFVSNSASIIANYTNSFITTLTVLLVVFLAILLVRPNIVQSTSTVLTQNPLKVFLYGVLTLIAFPLLMLVCIFFKALNGLTFILLAILLILAALSTIIVTISLAKLLDDKIEKTKSQNSILAYVLIVATALWLIMQIPYVQAIAFIVILITGLGTFVASLLQNKKKY